MFDITHSIIRSTGSRLRKRGGVATDCGGVELLAGAEGVARGSHCRDADGLNGPASRTEGSTA